MLGRRRLVRSASAIVAGLCLSMSGFLSAHAASPTIPAIVVGGSAAAGWNDPTGHGYVERGLKAFAAHEGLSFSITNYGIRGAPTVDGRVTRNYPAWLYRLGSNGLVVLAWGMLNDLRLGTPSSDVAAAIHRQIALALQNGDTVLVVAPPVTRLSVGKWRASEGDLVRLEVSVARRFDSPRVHVVNMFFPELHIWHTRHYNYHHFMANRFDPNLHGYILAGNILARQMEKSFDASALMTNLGAALKPEH